jgi:hypothetical protein
LVAGRGVLCSWKEDGGASELEKITFSSSELELHHGSPFTVLDTFVFLD